MLFFPNILISTFRSGLKGGSIVLGLRDLKTTSTYERRDTHKINIE
jgi:hypothetical protein